MLSKHHNTKWLKSFSMPSQGQKHISSLLPPLQGSLPKNKGSSGNNFSRRIWQRGSKIHSSSKTSLFLKKKSTPKIFGKIISRSIFVVEKVRFWRSYEFLILLGTSVVKSYCPNCPYFGGDFLGGGVNDSICAFNLDLAPKMTLTISWCDWMILW